MTRMAFDTATAEPATDGAASARGSRIALIDQLRGLALVAMAIYHFTWDLEFFGYIEPGTAGTGGWKIFARLIAGSFLFLAGYSLVLGHGTRLRLRAFLLRFAKIAAAALAITVATYFIFPDTFIFFGILHSIAAASLVGLIFLRAPTVVLIATAIITFAAPFYLRTPFFDHPGLWWVGLSETIPRSNDYVPLLPWFGCFLLGMAACRLWRPPIVVPGSLQSNARWKSLLATAGRHSLAIYLAHQPLLIGIVYAMSLVVPAERADPVAGYRASCISACSAERDAAFCDRFCGCTLDSLIAQDLFADLNAGRIDVATDSRINDISKQCTADSAEEPEGSGQ